MPLTLVQTTKDWQQETEAVSDLILSVAAPLIRHTVRERLGFFLNSAGLNSNHPEAEDLYQECLTRILDRLRDQRFYPDQESIRSFPQYVRSVATNACNDFLRMKYPLRNRLKHKVRDLVERHPDFAIWRNQTKELLCGFHLWQGHEATKASRNRLTELEDKPGIFKDAFFTREDIQYAPLSRIVARIFTWVNSPVELNRLVSLIAILLDIRDYPVNSIETDPRISEQLIDPAIGGEGVIIEAETLSQLWAEIRALPKQQRDIFCLSFTDDKGDDLFSLLLRARIITLPQLAGELNLSLDQLMVLWKKMPADNETLSAMLNVSRAQLNKWRFRAVEQLRKRITTALKIKG